MTDSTWAGEGIDPERASAARIYDYILGGRDHYPADREAGDDKVRRLAGRRTAASGAGWTTMDASPCRAPVGAKTPPAEKGSAPGGKVTAGVRPSADATTTGGGTGASSHHAWEGRGVA